MVLRGLTVQYTEVGTDDVHRSVCYGRSRGPGRKGEDTLESTVLVEGQQGPSWV